MGLEVSFKKRVRVAVGVRFFIVFSQDQKIESMKTKRKY